jgi:tripartite-type tricarboxylate transporter receptor subunit TctC
MKKFLAMICVAVMASTTIAAAGSYPEKPVKLIVPAKAGGALDSVTRMVAAQLEKKLGVPFPVVNVTGGASAIGIRQAADADQDGYTMFVTHQQMLVIGASGLLGFDPLEKFDGVGQTGLMENYLVTYKGAPFSNISELKAYAAANPGEINAGVNIGGLGHLVMVQIADGLAADFNYVNVPGGGAAKLKSLLGHFSEVAILGKGKFAGREDLVPLAVLANERSAAAPDVASAGEEDFPARFQLAFWWMMGKTAPAEAKSVIENALGEIMADEAVQKEFVERGIDAPLHLNAAETAASLEEQMVNYTASVSAISGN